MNYFRGTVEEFDERAGYGFIRSEEFDNSEKSLLVHRRSLRHAYQPLQPGDRVLFRIEHVPSGPLATDVHQEVSEQAEFFEIPERVPATIELFNINRHYGFIRLPDGSKAFFHLSDFQDLSGNPVPGMSVTCTLTKNERGLQAKEIQVETPEAATAGTPFAPDYLAQAIIARDNRQFDEAADFYEKGLRQNPSIQLILSYAALEKNRNRKSAAMRIYEEGIKILPDNAKLREDAGILAASIGDLSKSLQFLHESLDLCRRTRQGGEKGVLLAIARTNYKVGTPASLRESVSYYEQALTLFGRGHTRLPEADLLAMNIAKITIQHHRGNLTAQFLRSARLEIVRAKLLEQTTEGAEFIVEVKDPEFRESYGIAQHLVLRCMFKAKISRSDLDGLDSSVTDYAVSGLCDSQVALLIVSSLPDDLERLLWQRLEQRTNEVLVIVPIQQSEIETTADPLTVLRGVLDRWLYRRDLFAGRGPVVGRRFFGRDKPLAELRDAIATSTPTAIFGLRKVGKTSLLRESQRRSSESGDLVVYIDLLSVPSDISDCRWLYWKLAAGLRQELEKLPIVKKLKLRLAGKFTDYLDIPASFPVSTAFDSDLRQILDFIGALQVTPRPKVVLLLDEIERLLPTQLGKAGFIGFFDFFSYLRGVAQEASSFVVIVTGANAIVAEASQFDGRDNPVFNFFQEIYLQMLEESECTLMMRALGRGMGIRFTKEACAFVYALTGGHPFFTRQLCSFIAEQRHARPIQIDKLIIEELIDRYLDVRSGDFQEIVDRLQRDFPGEHTICVALAMAGGSLDLEAIRGHTVGQIGSTIRHLMGYQLVGIEKKRAYLTMELFTRWLRQRYAFN